MDEDVEGMGRELLIIEIKTLRAGILGIATVPAMNSAGTIHAYGASYRRRWTHFRLYQSGHSSFEAV